jgi:cysteine synthase A
MGKIYSSVDQLIGNTPLVELGRLKDKLGLSARILVKLESMNPQGSAKDRVAKAIFDSLERSGRLKPHSVVIEATSGNTGIGLASVAASRGYRAVIVMPDTMSRERMALIGAYGAELVLTDGKYGMTGAIKRAEEIRDATPDSFIAGQFENPDNKRAHFESTGPEIYSDTDGEVDIFVAGVGTGGTITGVGEYLKSKDQSITIVGVEPTGSPVLSEGHSGSHGLQGIGAGFVPKILNTDILDEIITVSEEEAYSTARTLARTEGILAGISSGAALFAAIKLASRAENAGKTIVALLPDTGERYLSSGLFDTQDN